MHDIRQDSRFANAVLQRQRSHIIVDTPAEIAGTGASTIAPPRVMMGLGVEVTESSYEPRIDKIFHPFSFCRKEARRVGIGFWIVNIYSAMTDIEITTNYQIRFFQFELIHIQLEIIQKSIFEILAHISCRARRKIRAHDRYILKVNTNGAPLEIIVFMSATVFHMCRTLTGKDRCPTIPFLLCRIPIMFVTHFFQKVDFGHLVNISFYFLQTDDIWRLMFQPT